MVLWLQLGVALEGLGVVQVVGLAVLCVGLTVVWVRLVAVWVGFGVV